LFVSMFLIVIGTGLLKPNVSNIVGDFYSAQDMRRDSGFSIFYMGINMGALIAPLIVGTLGADYNYHLGCGTADIGMLYGVFLSVFWTGILDTIVFIVVGYFYSAQDMRRDSGFSIFYMGINMGALIAPLIVGTLGQDYNYHLGFGTAAIGMFLGLIIFVVTRKKYLGLAGTYVPNPLKKEEKKKVYSRFAIGAIIIAGLVAIGIETGLLTINSFTYIVSFLAVTIPAAYFIVMYRSDKITSDERSRLLAYIPLFIAAMAF